MTYYEMAKDLNPDAEDREILDLCPNMLLDIGPEFDCNTFYAPDVRSDKINYYQQGCGQISCHKCWHQKAKR